MKMTNLCSANVATISHNSKSIQDLKIEQTIFIPKLNSANSNLVLLKKLNIKGPLGECSVILPKNLEIKIEKENLENKGIKISFTNQSENTPINTS